MRIQFLVVAVALSGIAPIAWAHEPEEALHLIQTTASAQEDVIPDSVSLSLEVLTQAETVEQARAENAQRMDQLVQAVKAKGWEELTVQTSRFNVSPVYEERRVVQSLPRVVGYRVSHLLTVTLETLDGPTLATRVSALLDEGMRLGSNQVYGPNFYVKDPEPIRERLLAGAVREAKARAQLMAEAAGVSLGPLHRLGDQSQPVYRASYMMDRMAGAELAQASTPVEVGEQTISVSVSVAYEVGAPQQE